MLTSQGCTTRVSVINLYFILCSQAQPDYFAATRVFLSLVELFVILLICSSKFKNTSTTAARL